MAVSTLFPLISLPLCFSANEHQVNPNLNETNLQDWIRNMQMKIKGRFLLCLTALMNLLPLTGMLRDQLFPTSFSFLYVLASMQFMHICSFSWLISLMSNARLNNVISQSVRVKCPEDLQTGTVKSSSVHPREGVGEGWREPAKWKTIYILSSIYFFVRLKWVVLILVHFCILLGRSTCVSWRG